MDFHSSHGHPPSPSDPPRRDRPIRQISNILPNSPIALRWLSLGNDRFVEVYQVVSDKESFSFL